MQILPNVSVMHKLCIKRAASGHEPGFPVLCAAWRNNVQQIQAVFRNLTPDFLHLRLRVSVRRRAKCNNAINMHYDSRIFYCTPFTSFLRCHATIKPHLPHTTNGKWQKWWKLYFRHTNTTTVGSGHEDGTIIIIRMLPVPLDHSPRHSLPMCPIRPIH